MQTATPETPLKARAQKLPHVVKTFAVGAAFVVVIVGLMLWLMGTFHAKVGTEARPVPEKPLGNTQLVAVRLIKVPAEESAVGTVRAVHETSIASKILAKIVAVNVRAGQQVKRGDVLVQLDDADIRARRQQAAAAVDSARAARDQAKVEFDRVERLFKDKSAARIELDRAGTALNSSQAELQRAEQTLKEADAILEYATVRSPIDGLVVDKKVDAGDTATPGQVLATMYDPHRMQLVASVRESLTRRLKVGQEIKVGLDVLPKACAGQVSEIVPEADVTSRSFLVKVTGPCPPGVYAGMFGRIYVPVDDEQLLVIPAAAVRHVGQLDMVDVQDGDVLRRRSVQLGRHIGSDVQVLSGLAEGERVAVPAAQTQEGT